MNRTIKKVIKKLLRFRLIARLFRKVFSRGTTDIQNLKIKRNLAIYDLGVNPVTFDICYFLYEASCFFRDYGIEKFELLIIANMKVRPWEQESSMINFINTEKKQQRIYDLLLPIAHLYKECESVELITDISTVNHILCEADLVYPHTYSIKYPQKMSYRSIYKNERNKVVFNGINVNPEDIDKVKNWLQQNNVNQPFVTFTLRSYLFQESRNSDFALLNDFLNYLKISGFLVVIVPDTDNIVPAAEFCESPIFFQGAFNIYQRAAIYELAFTNLFTSNGTHALSVFNKRSSFIFSKVLNEYHSVEHLENKGFVYGSQPFAEERGIWLWENESIEVLIAAFEKISDWKKKQVNL
jgi:hypothetical protein